MLVFYLKIDACIKKEQTESLFLFLFSERPDYLSPPTL